MDLTRRRLLAWGGNAAALQVLGGCESFHQSVLLRSPVYDTSAADAASNAAPRRRSADRLRASALPPLFDDIERRTFDFFWDTAQPGQRPGAGPLSDPLAGEHRGDRLRADRLPDRRRARLRHARAGARAHADHAALLPRRAAGPAAQRHGRLQGLLLSLPRHEDRPARRRLRAVDRRHRAAARRHAARAVLLRRRRIPTRREIRGAVDAIYARVDWRWAQVRGRLRSAWAGARRRASSRTTGAATTRRCWSCCSRSARRPTRSTTAPGPRGRTATRGAWGALHGQST